MLQMAKKQPRQFAFLLFLLFLITLAVIGVGSIILTNASAQTSTGNYGTDYSVNRPSLAGFTLLATIPVNNAPGLTRNTEIMPSCTQGILIVLDDGTDNTCSGALCTILPIAGPAVAGGQGGDWTNSWFSGRIRAYSTNATCQLAVRAR